jgi:hypothetical protein
MIELQFFKSVAEHRVRHVQGDRLALGFWWVEPEPIDFRKSIYFAVWAGGGFWAVTLLTARVPDIKGGLLLLAAAAVCFFLWRRARPAVATHVLGASFATDGEVAIVDELRKPKRVNPATLAWAKLEQSVDDIANIALQPTRNVQGGPLKFVPLNMKAAGESAGHMAYSIVIYFTSGETVEVGWHLTEPAGRVVQTQLNQALEAVRAKRLEQRGRQTAPVPAATPGPPPAASPAPEGAAREPDGSRWAPFGH